MFISAVYVRFFRSFNFDYLRKAHRGFVPGSPCSVHDEGLSVPSPFRSGGGLLGCGLGERPVGVHDAPLTVDELVAV